MTENLDIPFFPNTPDDTHCVQASLKMVMKYFWPAKDFSFDELDKITAKVPNMWTWPFAGDIWLSEHGIEVKTIQIFDIKRFAEEGEQYIVEFAGEKVAKAQAAHSDISAEKEYAKEYIRKVPIETRIPTIEDIKKLTTEGYVVTVSVNSYTLNGKEGYSGHRVVIIGISDEGVYINDPGLPPQENRFVPTDVFMKAWSYPDEKARFLYAYRRR